jgi:peptide methionine sulfoxide reductase MsrB
MPSVATYLGSTLDMSTSERICCNNHRYAEYRGYLEAPEVDFFGKLSPDIETIFYDSVCGIPLFIAPRGRSFDDFKEESLKHGWPSFRPEEIISENVILHDDGRMESRCLTHLGHNLPEGGVDRYCIDLVCMAGEPLSSDNERAEILTLIDGASFISHEELDATTYESSAETFSGKYNNWRRKVVIGVVCVASVAVVAMVYLGIRTRKQGVEDGKKSVEA